jgi:clan AA aspartic protease (TIGR02281 family)
MLRLFTVRWPLLARLDALLFFPVALIVAAEVAPLRTLVDHTIAPALPSFTFRLGLSQSTAFWIGLAIACFVPYVVLLVLTDRFLTVRKGYVLLSLIAISIWSAAGLEWSPHFAGLVPAHDLARIGFLSFGYLAALTAGGVALLLHLRPLWIGLRDQGDVAMDLIHGPRSAREDIDIYQRRMADFRGWKPDKRLDGIGQPGEGSGMRFLYVAIWIGVVFGISFAYYHWSGLGGGAGSYQVALPNVQATQPAGSATMHPSAMPVIAGLPTRAAGPAAPERPVATVAMPMVQRPSEMMSEPEDPMSGPNEAVAARGKDGSFAFNAIVNGAHVQMLFDTGASVVALRAEDAARFGIGGNLNYSAKVKTANGTADVAPIIIDTLTIGNITERRVIGYVAREGVLPRNLLGQSFLARLSGYNVENNQLVLKGPNGN